MEIPQGTITRFCYNKRGMLCSLKNIRIRVERIPRKELRCEITLSDSIDNLLGMGSRSYAGCTTKDNNRIAFESMLIETIGIFIICSRHGSPLEISRTFRTIHRICHLRRIAISSQEIYHMDTIEIITSLFYLLLIRISAGSILYCFKMTDTLPLSIQSFFTFYHDIIYKLSAMVLECHGTSLRTWHKRYGQV